MSCRLCADSGSNDGSASQLAGAHGHHAGAVRLQAHLVAAAVDADDAAQRLGGPVGAVLRARARALAGAHAHARVVGSGVAPRHHCPSSFDEAVAASAPPSEVLGALRSTGLQALPVLDEERRVVGWVCERDLVDRMYRDQRRAIAARTQTSWEIH